MDNKNGEKLKKCWVCRKTITDKNNKTGLCPMHKGKADTIVSSIGAIAILVAGGICGKKFIKK